MAGPVRGCYCSARVCIPTRERGNEVGWRAKRSATPLSRSNLRLQRVKQLWREATQRA
jgi:hypothetical protein